MACQPCQPCLSNRQCYPCTPLNLTLTSAVNNIQDYQEYVTQISADGSLVYIAGNQVSLVFANAQTLYTNNHGVLTQSAVMTLAAVQALSPAYANYTISAGVAAADFRLFALLIMPPTTPDPTPVVGYILFFNLSGGAFNLINTYTVNNVLGNFPFLNASQFAFTADNHYFNYVASVFTSSVPPAGCCRSPWCLTDIGCVDQPAHFGVNR